MNRTVLFVCTGNHYRSRFAEAVFNYHAKARGLAWRAISRGLSVHRVVEPWNLSHVTYAALVKRRIDRSYTSNFRTALTPRDLVEADLIIALCELEHRSMIAEAHPAWEGHVIYWGVFDVPHCSPDQALPLIETEVLLLLDSLADIPCKAEFTRPDPLVA